MGAHFTECLPDYGRDEEFQRAYAATAKDPDAYKRFEETFIMADGHDAYRRAVEANQ